MDRHDDDHERISIGSFIGFAFALYTALAAGLLAVVTMVLN